MRIENDYIMRLVAQLVQAIARALGLADQGRTEEAFAAVNDALTTALGPAYQDAFPNELADRVCGPNSSLAPAGFEIAALLTEAGRIRDLQGRHTAALTYYRHSFAVTRALIEEGSTPPPWNVNDLIEELAFLTRGGRDESTQR